MCSFPLAHAVGPAGWSSSPCCSIISARVGVGRPATRLAIGLGRREWPRPPRLAVGARAGAHRDPPRRPTKATSTRSSMPPLKELVAQLKIERATPGVTADGADGTITPLGFGRDAMATAFPPTIRPAGATNVPNRHGYADEDKQIMGGGGPVRLSRAAVEEGAHTAPTRHTSLIGKRVLQHGEEYRRFVAGLLLLALTHAAFAEEPTYEQWSAQGALLHRTLQCAAVAERAQKDEEVSRLLNAALEIGRPSGEAFFLGASNHATIFGSCPWGLLGAFSGPKHQASFLGRMWEHSRQDASLSTGSLGVLTSSSKLPETNSTPRHPRAPLLPCPPCHNSGFWYHHPNQNGGCSRGRLAARRLRQRHLYALSKFARLPGHADLCGHVRCDRRRKNNSENCQVARDLFANQPRVTVRY